MLVHNHTICSNICGNPDISWVPVFVGFYLKGLIYVHLLFIKGALVDGSLQLIVRIWPLTLISLLYSDISTIGVKCNICTPGPPFLGLLVL